MSCEFCPHGGGGCVVCALVGTPPGEYPAAAVAGADPGPASLAPCVVVAHGRQRAKLYSAGGVGFESYVPGVGWVVDDGGQTPALVSLACAVRRAAFPALAELSPADFA